MSSGEQVYSAWKPISKLVRSLTPLSSLYQRSTSAADWEKLLHEPTCTQRIPSSLQASAMVSGVRYISMIEVTPVVRYSRMASLVSSRMSSGVRRASKGKTWLLSQSCSGRSSACERRKVIAECVCASLKPGMSRLPPQSISRSKAGDTAPAAPSVFPPSVFPPSVLPVPAYTIRSPSTQTSPSKIGWSDAFSPAMVRIRAL